jgi:hypothetical protein
MKDSELENCLSELRALCEHLEPPPTRWQKIKLGVINSWLWNDLGDTLIGIAVWIGLIVGVPVALSMCGSKESPGQKSPHGDAVAQYTVTYYDDGAQDWEEVIEDQSN